MAIRVMTFHSSTPPSPGGRAGGLRTSVPAASAGSAPLFTRSPSSPSAFEQGLVIAFLLAMAVLFGWRYYDREKARDESRLAGADLANAQALLDAKTAESASAAMRRETVGPTGLNLAAPGPASLLAELRQRLGPVSVRRCQYAPASTEASARFDLVLAGRTRAEIVAAIARLGTDPFAEPVVVSITDGVGGAEANVHLTVNS
jgi:hypothetical protein